MYSLSQGNKKARIPKLNSFVLQFIESRYMKVLSGKLKSMVAPGGLTTKYINSDRPSARSKAYTWSIITGKSIMKYFLQYERCW